MPILEYKCDNDHITEKIVLAIVHDSIEANAETVCKECGGKAKIIFPTSSSFRLKPGGVGGFYKPHQD